jgi:hypothetical protein
MSSNGAGAPSAEAKARGGELGLVACTALVVGNILVTIAAFGEVPLERCRETPLA